MSKIGKVSEWAKAHDFSRQNAYKILNRHSIPWDRVAHTVDFELADQIWEASRNPGKQAGGAAGGEAARDQGGLFDAPSAVERGGGSGSPLGQAQLAHMMLRIKRDRLTLDQMEAKLVPLAGVRAFEAAVFAEVKNQILPIGAELRDDLAAETDPARCQAMIDRRLERALTNLSTWRPDSPSTPVEKP